MSKIGPARQAGDGWYALDGREMRVDLDQVEAGRLAGGQRPQAGEGYQVLEAVQDGSMIRVRVAAFVDLPDPHLWQQKQPVTHLIIKLREGIARLGGTGLADELAAGRLAPVPARPRLVAGFTAQQRKALEACLGTGVRLVWGPPGTGKTRVLAEAINELLSAGRRVLLVSATNIAVDNALLGVVAARRFERGVLLRVGVPHHPGMLEHPQICLQPLVRERLAEVEAERQNLEKQLLGIRQEQEQLARLNEALTGFDLAAYQSVQARSARRLQIPALSRDRDQAAATRTAAETRTARLRADLSAAELRVRDLEGTRVAYQHIDVLAGDLDRERRAADSFLADSLKARAEAARLAAELRRLAAEGLLTRLRNRGARRRLRTAWEGADQAAVDAEARTDQGKALFGRRADEVANEIRRLQATTIGSPADIVAADQRLVDARGQLQSAEEEVVRADGLVGKARQALLEVEQQAPVTEDERAAAEQADRLDLPARATRRDALQDALTTRAPQSVSLHERYEKTQATFDRLRMDAEGELIRAARVVATTLARMRTSKAVMDGPYDVVLVDEAGAANLPEVLLAASRATRSAVLFGDFMQLGAILPRSVTTADRPDVQRWLTPDVFAHCGIRVPGDASRHDGCIVLDVQHRFGPDIMGLANAVAYDGVLRAGAQIKPHATDDPEIVLLDVDGLGDLGIVRSTGRHKGWWPAGALISRVLADYHQERGERTGVVTPYGDQVDATLEAVRDQELSTGAVTEVGTAHRFQGREFPIVVFDLVEDDRIARWMSAATLSRGPYERDGVRLFNVAITRAQDRLYIIGSRRRIDEAPVGSPLAQLALLLRDRRARTVPAARLVSPTDVDADEHFGLGVFGTELAEVLARHVQISAIDDEVTFHATFAEHLAEAERSIWLWAPWTRARLMSLIPLLADASDRGVVINVFVRDPGDSLQVRADSQQYLRRLRKVVRSVVAVQDMHQKIVVIDDRVVLLGSLNALSYQHSREVMLTVRGKNFARRLLAHEHADAFVGPPPRCEICKETEVGLRRQSRKGWQWYCYSPSCPQWHRRGLTNWSEQIRL